MSNDRKIYFTAGPAKMPKEVREQVQRELLDFNGTQLGIFEISHRSKEFDSVVVETEANLRKLLNVPENYSILFMHGGAKTQFDSIPMNLCQELKSPSAHAEYLVNGSWSKMAASEAQKYIQVRVQALKSEKFDRQPEPDELGEPEAGASYRYYCDNETIQGVEYNYVPEAGQSASKVPLVCDMTSNFLSRPVDVGKFGLIFAGAQKNCGIAGLCIVIVRNDLIGHQMAITPTIQNYKITKENRSLYNTPLTLAIYIAGLCFKWMLDRGGLVEMEKFSREKSALLYETIDQSKGFYTCPVKEVSSRSRMNVVFLLADKSLEAKFLEESKASHLYELKGHRSVGGFRASVYHGISLEDVKLLVKFMKNFQAKYGDATLH